MMGYLSLSDYESSDYEGGYYVIGRLEIDERLQKTIR